MKLCLPVCLLFLVSGLGSVISQNLCADGDLRLVNGYTPSNGRVEVCFSNTWGTVCDDDWDNDDARVVCRQLGFSLKLAVGIDGAFFGQGSGPIFIDESACIGTEAHLINCTHPYPSRHNCFHFEDASVRCAYNGDISLVLNGEVLQNNSIVPLEEISEDLDGGLFCLTNLYPCCSGSEDGNWYQPNGLQLGLSGSVNEYYQGYHALYQSVILQRPSPAELEGLFHCEIVDQLNITQHLYVGIYLEETDHGKLTISNISYDSALQTVICTSTGGPVTSVTWSRDNVPIDITDRTTYQHSQVVTDTSTATYQSKLWINPAADLYGVYVCNVNNSAGNAFAAVAVFPSPEVSTGNECSLHDMAI